LSDIAQRYGVSQESIREANNMEKNARIAPGDKLTIPLEPTPTPTATQTPTATLTPGPPYQAPHLLYPPDEAAFQGSDQVVTLNWDSVGILNEGESYVIHLRYLGPRRAGLQSEITIETQVTSWRVPPELYPGQGATENRFIWTVTVVRQADKDAVPVTISSPGEERSFRWE
jgi:hypothetical protein